MRTTAYGGSYSGSGGFAGGFAIMKAMMIMVNFTLDDDVIL